MAELDTALKDDAEALLSALGKPPDADSEPKARKERSDKGVPRGTRGKRAGIYKAKLKSLLDDLAGIVTLVNPDDAAILAANSDKLATAYDPVVARHASLKRAVDTLTGLSSGGGAIAATIAVALPILAGHNMLPARLMPMGMMMRYKALNPEATPAETMMAGAMAMANGNGQETTEAVG
jgi:hypothetical protein